MFGILICLIKMFHRHFSRYGQKADLKTPLEVDEVRGVSLILIQPRAAQRGGGLLVHTLESPNQPQPPS